MTTTTNAPHAAVATLKLPVKVPALIQYAQGIVKSMTANPSFPNPTPTLALVTAAIVALNTAETAALARTKGAVLTRNGARTALVTLLRQLRGYIQAIADADAESSAPTIASAGIAVRRTPVRPPRAFHATPGPVSGSAKVVVPSAARRAAYDWEYSADGGKTWVAAPSTLGAKTTIPGLPAGTTVQFRFRALTKTGEGDWSQPTSLLVK
ncbi:MAG TPA: fibronectin type III domain-containing protein [Polyangiaceae bacterium]|jgi:hypothetical protein